MKRMMRDCQSHIYKGGITSTQANDIVTHNYGGPSYMWWKDICFENKLSNFNDLAKKSQITGSIHNLKGILHSL